MGNEILLQMKNITKVFPGCKALDNVDLTVKKGSVHALMGENGAGKSTLIKVLTGVHQADEGEMYLNGEKVHFSSPKEALDKGISTIYQELDLIPELSIEENIFLGREILKGKFIDWKQTFEKAREIMQSINIDIDVRSILSSHSTAIQQMVSIARAISVQARLVVMDEPTSSLDEKEVEILFKVINDLKSRGVSIIFITHKLDEVFQICDDMTIMRDGVVVANTDVQSISKLKLVSLMLGRDSSGIIDQKKDYSKVNIRDENVLIAENLSRKPKVINQSLNLKKGEILGLAGLLGSGRTELARLVFGVDRPECGDIYVKDEKVNLRTPRDAIKKNMAFCFEDRKVEGIIPEMSVKDNITLAIMPKISKMGVVSKKKQDEIVDKFIKALRIKVSDPEQPIKSLSGGNQQKVLLARALASDPELLILDEPTRGIDVGAKKEILDITESLAEEGIAVLLISSELQELVSSCSKINVIRDGKKVGELEGEEISEKAILKAIAGDVQ
mgnify:CR=1 FL=1